MARNPAKALAQTLAENMPDEQLETSGVSRKDAEQVIYRQIRVFIDTTAIGSLILVLSILIGSWESALFVMIGFLPIRRTMGGFHFKNIKYCFVTSVLSFTALGWVSSLVNAPKRSFMVLAFAIAIGVYTLHKRGIVDTSEVYITRPELRENRHRRFYILGVRWSIALTVASAILLSAGFYNLVAGIAAGMIIAYTMLWMAEGRETGCGNGKENGLSNNHI